MIFPMHVNNWGAGTVSRWAAWTRAWRLAVNRAAPDPGGNLCKATSLLGPLQMTRTCTWALVNLVFLSVKALVEGFSLFFLSPLPTLSHILCLLKRLIFWRWPWSPFCGCEWVQKREAPEIEKASVWNSLKVLQGPVRGPQQGTFLLCRAAASLLACVLTRWREQPRERSGVRAHGTNCSFRFQ